MAVKQRQHRLSKHQLLALSRYQQHVSMSSIFCPWNGTGPIACVTVTKKRFAAPTDTLHTQRERERERERDRGRDIAAYQHLSTIHSNQDSNHELNHESISFTMFNVVMHVFMRWTGASKVADRVETKQTERKVCPKSRRRAWQQKKVLAMVFSMALFFKV